MSSNMGYTIVVVSGSGRGAGKSTLATRLANGSRTWSIAGALRDELTRMYPGYAWFDKRQEYKDNTRVAEYKDGRSSVRDVLVEWGQAKCVGNPTYWIDRLIDRLKGETQLATGTTVYAIDDLRKACEIERLRAAFPGRVLHFHIDFDGAIPEPEFENDALRVVADYVIKR